MKRNTALTCIGWLGTFAVVNFTPIFRELKYHVWASVAHQKYDFPVPATAEELHQFMQTHQDARGISFLIVLGIVAVFAMFVGSIIVVLFGEPNADKTGTPK